MGFMISYGLFQVFDPVACVDEGLDPRGYLVVPVLCGIVTALPWEHRALEVRHHRQVATIVRADTGYGPW